MEMIEQVDEPEPGSSPSRAGGRGNKASQRIPWPGPGVVDAYHDPAGCNPDPQAHGRTPVAPGRMAAERLLGLEQLINERYWWRSSC